MSLGKRWFAFLYHNFLSSRGHPDLSDHFTREIRIPLLQQAAGDVLEIGAGDGANLPFYPAGVRLTLTDANPYLLRHIPEVTARLGIAITETRVARGEELPYPDQHFDTVITTHVLCSVSDQARVMHEVHRVLRPGGRFLFLEHVGAEQGTATFRLQRTINPVWKTVGDGCHLTRDTAAAIRAAGFVHVEIRPFLAEAPGIVSPHITGVAYT